MIMHDRCMVAHVEHSHHDAHGWRAMAPPTLMSICLDDVCDERYTHMCLHSMYVRRTV